MVRRTPIWLLVGGGILLLSAFFPLSFPQAPGQSVGPWVATALIAAPALYALFRYMGVARATVCLTVVSLFAYAIEVMGVITGLPYGEFSYGEMLGPKLAGAVPWLLPVTYVPLVIGAVAVVPPGGGRALRAAVVLVAFDAVLDPGAVALGLWEWAADGIYYGVPLSNYVGWLISGTISCTLLLAAGEWKSPPRPGLLDGAVLAIAFWTGVALFAGLVVAAALGAGLVAYLLYRRSRMRLNYARG